MGIKIIATLGPSSANKSIIKKMISAGMNIARINMKHSPLSETRAFIDILSKLNCKILLDIEDVSQLEKIKQLKFDYLALSFTESAKQIKELRSLLSPRKVLIIAKIETRRGIRNINEIIKESDGVMVARGDLGKHTPLEQLPIFQKIIIKRCNENGKFVITATEMLLSMICSKIPTRAEASDVANAILDGSNALMLSEETAIGKYPAESVSMMRRIINETIKNRKHL